MLYFGIHVGKSSKVGGAYGSLLDAIKDKHETLGINAAQIFTRGPRSYSKNKYDDEPIKYFCKNNDVKIFNHGSYVSVNIWHMTKDNMEEPKQKSAIAHISDTLQDTKNLGGELVVVHVPRHTASKVASVMNLLNLCGLLSNYKPYICLEMPASKPQINGIPLNEVLTYETPVKLNYLVKSLGKLNYKLCIDTAHQWAGGVDFSTKEGWDSYIDELSKDVKKRLALIHLNGAYVECFGTGKDMHNTALSSTDALWGKFITKSLRERAASDNLELTKEDVDTLKKSGFYAILKYCFDNNVAIICELNTQRDAETRFLFNIIHALTKKM